MAEIQERYQEVLEEFDTLLEYGIKMSRKLEGREAPHDREYYAELIFRKLLCHAVTLRRIAPTGQAPKAVDSTELWDVSSACAVTRALLEAYDALFYVAIDDVQAREREFRILLWKLHAAERRQKMLRLIGSDAPDVVDVDNWVTELRRQLASHEYFNGADSSLKNKVQNGNVPQFHLRQADRNTRAEVSHEYYNVVVMFLSSYVHTHPFSIHQLMEFRAGDAESLRLISTPVQYASGFFAKGIQGMRLVFGDVVAPPSETVSAVLDTWIHIVEHGVRSVS